MSNEKGVDEKKLNAMKVKILKAEQDNLKTREKTSEQMAELLKQIIAKEARKGF